MAEILHYFIELFPLQSGKRLEKTYRLKNYEDIIIEGDLSKNLDETHSLKVVITPIIKNKIVFGADKDRDNTIVYYAPPSIKEILEKF